MVSGHLVRRLDTLTKSHHQMKRRQQTMQQYLKKMEEERKVSVKSLDKKVEQLRDVVTDVVDVAVLLKKDTKTNLDRINNTENKNTECMDRLKKLEEGQSHVNNSMIHVRDEVRVNKHNISNILNNLNMFEERKHLHENVSTTTTSTTQLSTTTTPTTSLAAEEAMDILIAHDDFSFSRYHIKTDSATTLNTLSLGSVYSMTYLPSISKLFISDFYSYRYRLVLYDLTTSLLTTVRKGVKSYGMAVDNTIQTVFMTTFWRPGNTISRLEIGSWNFTSIVDIDKYGGRLTTHGIAVDTKHRMIYACVWNKLLTTDYDGQQVETLYTGSWVFAVTLDPVGQMLYFNDDRNLMSRSLVSGEMDIKVLEIGYVPRTLIYYNNSIYSFRGSTFRVIHLHRREDNTQTKDLHTFSEDTHVMCMIPSSV